MLKRITFLSLLLMLSACASNEVSIHEPHARFSFHNNSSIDPIINTYNDLECKIEQPIALAQEQRSSVIAGDYASRIKPDGRWTGRIRANQPYIFRVLAAKDWSNPASDHCGILLKIDPQTDQHYYLTFNYNSVLNGCSIKFAKVDNNGNLLEVDRNAYLLQQLPYTKGVCQ